MIYQTTIEIDEMETEVLIHFEMKFGEPVIIQMIDVFTDEAIAPDLLDEITPFTMTNLLNELHEVAADKLADKKSNGRNFISC